MERGEIEQTSGDHIKSNSVAENRKDSPEQEPIDTRPTKRLKIGNRECPYCKQNIPSEKFRWPFENLSHENQNSRRITEKKSRIARKSKVKKVIRW